MEQLLSPGKQVSLKCLNPYSKNRDRYAINMMPQEFDIFEGTIVPNPRWFDPTDIALTTGDRKFPIRRIARSAILAVNDTITNFTPIKNDRIEVIVQGSKGNTYVVTKENGKSSCTCTGFSFRRTCKHIQNV
jgi:hypothetical protein